MAHRMFKDKPTIDFQDAVVREVAKTGEPEKVDGLFTGRIPRDAKYEILRRIVVDGRKRPNGDMAPCPMCTPNRFLEGDLVHLYEMKVVAVIGRCCAAHAAEADRAYKRAEAIRYEEDYLMAALPFVRAKIAAVKEMGSIAGQALTLYRKFRKEMPELQQMLRTIKDRQNAQLVLHEILEAEELETKSDYVGPRGFRGGVLSRDIQFGPLGGTTAVIKDYNPVKELGDVDRNINFTGFEGDADAAVLFVADMTPEQRRASVFGLQHADRAFEKFVRRTRDCVSFFSRENIERLGRFGAHHLNHQPFEASYRHGGKGAVIQFRHAGTSCLITAPPDLWDFKVDWEMVPYKKS